MCYRTVNRARECLCFASVCLVLRHYSTNMWCAKVLLCFLVVGALWNPTNCTCVLESEFGFTVNCAFKKSGLFRVRNLGGIKAHVGLGFTVGDELGFPESLSNTEFNRRRSSQTNKFQNVIIAEGVKNAANNQINKKMSIGQTSTPMPQQKQRQIKQQPQLALAIMPPKMPTKVMGSVVPPFKPIPPAAERVVTNRIMSKVDNMVPKYNSRVVPSARPGGELTAAASVPRDNKSSLNRTAGVLVMGTLIPEKNKKDQSGAGSLPHVQQTLQFSPGEATDKNVPVRSSSAASQSLPNTLPQVSMNTIRALAGNSNISVEAIESVIRQRQEQLVKQRRASTLQKKKSGSISGSTGQVMNAPKEYYPVGYDKNFDDNFASRVDLPDTSFYCGDQKHFPGLYADEDLGCMVFHVCAITDDGLIMKSFVCPESTIFDQTILKCNWWFYVDCKNSKNLYTSNIPVSKSYQLMKALTFFSSYKREQSASAATTDKTAKSAVSV